MAPVGPGYGTLSPGDYNVMSRATDSVGNVQSHEPRYNNMRKNFSAIVGYGIKVE